jgi:hypothetical protein
MTQKTFSANPVELNFYDASDALVKTYSRARVPSYLFDMAIDLGQSLSGIEETNDGRSANEKTAPLFDFIVEFYGNQFTREELKRATDLGECLAVYQQVLTRAYSMMSGLAQGNPILPSPKKK